MLFKHNKVMSKCHLQLVLMLVANKQVLALGTAGEHLPVVFAKLCICQLYSQHMV